MSDADRITEQQARKWAKAVKMSSLHREAVQEEIDQLREYGFEIKPPPDPEPRFCVERYGQTVYVLDRTPSRGRNRVRIAYYADADTDQPFDGTIAAAEAEAARLNALDGDA